MPFDDEYIVSEVKTTKPAPVAHYYGDVVRMLLVGAGVLLLLSALFDKNLLAFNIVVGIVLVLVLVVVAGLTSPRNYFAMLVDTVVSALLFVVYELLAVLAYNQHDSIVDISFALRQGIAFAALGALYFSVKSLRGFFARAEDEE